MSRLSGATTSRAKISIVSPSGRVQSSGTVRVWSRICIRGRVFSVMPSSAGAGVKRGVKQIDDDVGQHDEKAAQQDHANDDRAILVAHGVYRQGTYALQSVDLLDHDC